MSLYGLSLLRRVVAALDITQSMAATARQFSIDEKTARSYHRRAAEGRLEADRSGPKHHVKLTIDDIATFKREVADRPDQTLRELKAKLSVDVAESTVWRALNKLGLSFKESR